MDTRTAHGLAGTALITAGALIILGFTTAEAMYPGYSTTTQTISALGAAAAPAASRLVFNSVMVVAGLVTAVAAYGLHHAYGRRSLTGVLTVTGIVGFAGVGLFPAQTGLPHFLAALVAFGGVGVTALVVARVVEGPFRYVSAVLGVLELLALVGFVVLRGATPLGVGGLERYVAYLGVVWATAFGGVLLARATHD